MVTPTLEVGGMERLTLDLSKNLIEMGHEVSVTCVDFGGELAEVAQAGGIPVHVLEGKNRGTALRRHLKKQKADVVHLHMAPWLRTALAARLARSRFVQTLHGVPEGLTRGARWSMRLAAELTHAVVLVSAPLGSFAIRDIGVPTRKLTTILNGIDVDRFSPVHAGRDLRTELGMPSGARILGTVARLAPVKNQGMMLRALALLEPSFHLVFAGDGEGRSDLEGLSRSLDLADRVHFLGSITDTVPVLRAMDAFLLTSKAEGLPMCLLEAMACQIPIVSTAVGGIPDLLQGGHLGRLVDGWEPRELASSIEELFRLDPVPREQTLQAARAICVDQYSSRAMSEAYLRTYRGK